VAERIVLRLLEKDPRKRYRDGHHLLEELKALQRSLPSQGWEGGDAQQPAPVPPPPPANRSADVTEWANRAGLFSRMIARAFPGGNSPKELSSALSTAWDLAAKASGLEGEIASHTRRLEALERRGRALRAEIGRKVEELAQEESRALRDAANYAEEEKAARAELANSERQAEEATRVAADAERNGAPTRSIFERSGAALAMVDVRRQELKSREAKRAAREATARDLRQQIEELRAQLARYAEALEEDLASGREKVATRAREGLEYESRFEQASGIIVQQLRGKPECRELFNEFITSGVGKVADAAAGPEGAPMSRM
jgi:serine/threonine-protein kinase